MWILALDLLLTAAEIAFGFAEERRERRRGKHDSEYDDPRGRERNRGRYEKREDGDTS